MPYCQALSSSIFQLNRNLNSLDTNKQFGVERAYENPQLIAAVIVDLNNPLGDWNKPCIVLSSTGNVPSDMAWGIKEVLYIDSNAVLIRITGCKTNGVDTAVWTSAYNHGTWTGWTEH